VKHLSGAPLKGKLLALSANNRLGWKVLPGANAPTFTKIRNYGRKKLYNIGPSLHQPVRYLYFAFIKLFFAFKVKLPTLQRPMF
jgi:hypothetical protein